LPLFDTNWANHAHSGASADRVRVWSENRIPSASNADFNRRYITGRTLNCWPGRVRTMIPTWIPSTPEIGLGHISTLELLRAEEIWIEKQRRPKPHARDVALMKRVVGGAVVQHCVGTERRVEQQAALATATDYVCILSGQIYCNDRAPGL
jgi:hypothetical protein